MQDLNEISKFPDGVKAALSPEERSALKEALKHEGGMQVRWGVDVVTDGTPHTFSYDRE